MKRFISVTLSFCFFILCISTSFAANNVDISSNSKDVISKIINSINKKDWNTYINLHVSENRETLQNFINNTGNKTSEIGLFGIQSAALKEIKELSLDSISAFTDIERYRNTYSDLKAYLVGIEYKVSKETKYYFNGVNYSLFILANESGEWHELEASDAPLEMLIPMGLGFGSSDEDAALKIVNARIKGVVINKSGKQLDTNKATQDEINAEKGITSSSTLQAFTTTTTNDHVIPSSIRVYRHATGVTETVQFYSYLKNVLPNEWGDTEQYTTSLKAGAMAVKMYGWYHVYHPKWSSLGADVYDNTNDQVYIPSTEEDTTTAAINSIGGVALQNSSGNVFEAQYLMGTSGDEGTQYSGIMRQYGTVVLQNWGYTYFQMCHYYYDFSDKSSGAISTFSY